MQLSFTSRKAILFRVASLTFLSVTLFFCSAISRAIEFDGHFINLTLGQLSQTGLSTQDPALYLIDDHRLTARFTSNANHSVDFGAEAGITTLITPQLALLWSAGLYQSSGTTLSGDYTYDVADTSSGPDGNYQYTLSSVRLMLLGTARYAPFKSLTQLSLLGQVGLGYGQLRANSYSATALNSADAPVFSSSSRYQSMYQYGVGAEYEMFTHWSLGLHYDWLNWGSTTLASASSEQNTGEGLATGTVKMTRTSLQLGYQF